MKEEYLVHPANLNYLDDDLTDINNRFINYGKNNFNQNGKNYTANGNTDKYHQKQQSVLQLINAYRFTGHLFANLDPLGRANSNITTFDLNTESYGLTSDDLNTEFETGSFFGLNKTTLKNIISQLKKTYVSTMGFDYMHMVNVEEKRYLQEIIEKDYPGFDLTKEKKKWVLEQLSAAETFEKFLHNKYTGQKRFSLEGGESTIVVLNQIINHCNDNYKTKQISLGMAHRGRLNVLVNVFGKKVDQLFKEFNNDFDLSEDQTGDVKYHLGFSSDINVSGGKIHASLAFNPSHLEIVNPVVEGYSRYHQEVIGDSDGSQVVPILIHGDAALIGQGVVMETLNMSQSKGYRTHGTIHIVINNQIGFTTSNQNDARSTLHCTDIAKMINAPIIHVNAEDLESVVFATNLAIDYKMKFKKDVVIDLVCYRRNGHNEADEPSVTQPDMYKRIRALKTTRQSYADKLISQGVINKNDADDIVNSYYNRLKKGESVVSTSKGTGENVWDKFKNKTWQDPYTSSLSKENIEKLSDKILKIPKDFELHPIVKKTLDTRKKMAYGETPMDWGCAENLAYASLANDGFSIRLSGQDSGRGTFFHRHAVLHNQKRIESYTPLQHISKKQGAVTVVDSVLSEVAVLGFEYGYSSTAPNSLTIWEAQFGDFANGAQVVIDQFISSAEVKWGRLSGLVMMLPHALEGAGPEHSSGRIERFLQLCSRYNMQVCVPTSASQIFHLLRRQMLRDYRKPLIIFTPKSLLRNPLANSPIEKFTSGSFKTIIGEQYEEIVKQKVKRIVICSGKIFYELLTRRTEEKITDVAIIRIEQLYPFSRDDLSKELKVFKNAKELIWCQEEPINQGAWYTSRHQFNNCAKAHNLTINAVARNASAASAEGNMKLHKINQNIIIEQALGLQEVSEEQ